MSELNLLVVVDKNYTTIVDGYVKDIISKNKKIKTSVYVESEQIIEQDNSIKDILGETNMGFVFIDFKNSQYLEVTKMLKNFNALHIVWLSDKFSASNIKQGLKLGVDGFLSLPLKESLLGEEVNKYFLFK